mmetsp:Transcript_66846/g.116237  ORF Transcript_66846/g.116237 Transcript_66846/m.116237 type:complete len:83 (-) Transcript_66846:47-295(-)
MLIDSRSCRTLTSSAWCFLLLVCLLTTQRAEAARKSASEGLWVVFAACAALGITFVLALLCVRGLEYCHRKITGQDYEDKDL